MIAIIELLGIADKYSNDLNINYSNLSAFVTSFPEKLDKFSTKNLLNILSQIQKNQPETINRIESIVMNRLEKENCKCDPMITECFFRPISSNNLIFSKIKKENLNILIDNIQKRGEKTKGTNCEKIFNNITYLAEAANFLEYFEDGIFNDENVQTLENMINENKNAVNNVNFGIFKKEIYEKLGKDYVVMLSKFPNISKMLITLEEQYPKLFDIYANKVKESNNIYSNSIKNEDLVTYFYRECTNIDLTKISEKDLVNAAILNCKSTQFCDIISIKPQENYERKLEEQCDLKFNKSRFIDDKKNAYFNKYLSMSYQECKKFMEEYASEKDQIKNEKTLELINKIESVLDEDNKEKIDKLFYAENKKITPEEILDLTDELISDYAMSYTKELANTDLIIENKLNPKNNEIINNKDEKDVNNINENNNSKQSSIEEKLNQKYKNVKKIKLNDNFNFLVHSTDTQFVTEVKGDINDFKSRWNQNADKSNHIISMSYINQDFLGCAPVGEKGVLYGFTQVDKDKIKLMGSTDINSYSRNFAYDANTKKYLSAKTMPYNSRRVYNEIAVERNNTEPNYVILFDDENEKIQENAYMAASQMGIPLVQLNKENIKNSQIQRLNDLLIKFNDTKDPKIFESLISTYETNVAGWLLNRSTKEEDKTFTHMIDNSRFKDDFENIFNKINNNFNTYLEDMEKSDKNVDNLKNIMEIVLKQRDLYSQTEVTKPITKTVQSYDSTKMIEKINQTFEKFDKNNYQVNIENIPCNKEYKKQISMREIVKNAINHNITKEDVENVIEYENSIKLKETIKNKEEERNI